MHTPKWYRLFPDEDFRWSMSLRPGDGSDFFAASSRSDETLALRRERITNQGEYYVVIPSEADDLVVAALDLFAEFTAHRFNNAIEAGAGLEPDWVLMSADESGCFRIEGGVVCFPSFWSLPEKAGLAIGAVHGPVPKLNESLAGRIDTFLARLVPGAAWERENWGLSADDELDHHPRLPRKPLIREGSLDATWLRLERQLFCRLPGGGVLFGIRVSNHCLHEVVKEEPELAARIARALRTMPEDVADYKGIATVRLDIAQRLTHRK